MSADGFFDTSSVLVEAVLDALRADEGVRAQLDDPARIFDGETPAPVFPYAVLERHEQVPRSVSGVAGAEHRLQFVTRSRSGGAREAKQILDALARAFETMELDLTGQRVVLTVVTYADAMRTRDLQAFRGVLRVKLIVEEQ